MLTLTSAEAQNRFGQLIDAAQREPITVTRRGRPVLMLLAVQDYEALQNKQTPDSTSTQVAASLRAIEAFRSAGSASGVTGGVAGLLADRKAERLADAKHSTRAL